jgi:hypothetical protein
VAVPADPQPGHHLEIERRGQRPGFPRSGRCGRANGGVRLLPASPHLFDAVLRLPLMDVTRAHTELGWLPRYSALEAIQAFLDGLRGGVGMDTPPLTRDTGRR